MTLLLFAVQVLAAWSVGEPLRRRLEGAPQPCPVARLALGLLLGAGAFSMMGFLLLATGTFHPWVGVATLLLCAGVGLSRVPWKALALLPRPDALDAAGALAAGAFCFHLILLCNSPSIMIDSYMYHLLVPKQWMLQGRMIGFPWDFHSNLHLGTELWWLWGQAWAPEDVVLPKLSQAGAALLMAMLLWSEGRRRFGRLAGWALAASWLAARETLEFATDAYIDVGHAALILAALLAMGRAVEGLRDAGAAAGLRDALLAGILWGLAIATKTSAHIPAVLAGVAWTATLLLHRAPAGPALRATLRLAGGAFVVAAPWVVKNAWITGSPYYPMLLNVFPVLDEYRRVAEDFQRSYASLGGLADVSALLAQARLYLSNVPLLDQNRFVVVFLGALLWRLRALPTEAGERFLWLAGALLLPICLFTPAWRFVLGGVALLWLLGLGTLLTALRPLMGRLPAAPKLAAGALLLVAAWRLQANVAWSTPALPAREAVPAGWYFSTATQRTGWQQRQPWWGAVEAVHAHARPGDRLLFTENAYAAVLFRVPMLVSPPMHSPTVLHLVPDVWGVDADGLARELQRHGVTLLLTRDPLATPLLQRFAAGHLEPLWNNDTGLRLFRLRPVTAAARNW